MKSKTSFFNRSIFFHTLRRYWVLWVLYAAACLALIALPLLNQLQLTERIEFEWFEVSITWLLQRQETLLFLSLISGGVIAAVIFSYLYSPRQMGLMNSLPVRREAMFLSVLSAGFAGMLIGDGVLFLSCLGMEAAYGQVYLPTLCIFLVILIMENILFLGFASFCCMLTGNILAGPVVYLIFNFTAVGVEGSAEYLLNAIVYGMDSMYNLGLHTGFLSPPVMLLERLHLNTEVIYDSAGRLEKFTYSMDGLGVLAVYCLIGVCFALLALLLYRRRNMEVAGDVVAIPLLVPVFKVCACLAGALMCTSVVNHLMNDLAWYGVPKLVLFIGLMWIGGAVGWFVAQMLVEKTFRVFRHGWKGLGIMCLIYAVFFTAAEFDWTGYEHRVPDPSEVAHVTVFAGAESFTLEDPENIRQAVELHRRVIDHRDIHEASVAQDKSIRLLQLEYELTDGSILRRMYWIDADQNNYPDMDSDLRAVQALLNLPEAIEQRYVIEDMHEENFSYGSISYYDPDSRDWRSAYDLSPADYMELYNTCILPDIADGTLGQYDLVEDKAYALSKYDCQIYLDLRWSGDGPESDLPVLVSGDSTVIRYNAQMTYRSIHLYVTVTAQRTVQWLEDHGISLVTVYDSALSWGGCYTDTGYVYQGDAVASYAERTVGLG